MDARMPFLRPIFDRYFEDYIEGDVHCFGTIAVNADEIVAFAKQFDPQTLHIDPEAAKSGPFRGLIASGWHTAGLMTRLFVDHYQIPGGGDTAAQLCGVPEDVISTGRVESAVVYCEAELDASAMALSGLSHHAPVSVERRGNCERNGADG
jgi:acyl dehydratase